MELPVVLVLRWSGPHSLFHLVSVSTLYTRDPLRLRELHPVSHRYISSACWPYMPSRNFQ